MACLVGECVRTGEAPSAVECRKTVKVRKCGLLKYGDGIYMQLVWPALRLLVLFRSDSQVGSEGWGFSGTMLAGSLFASTSIRMSTALAVYRLNVTL